MSKFRFIGVGDAAQQGLGHASACFQSGDQHLLIDLGPGVMDAFIAAYDKLPEAIYITHCHLDHIGDFERLFIRCWFSQHKPLIFVPANLIPLLHERVGTYPGALAEGGVNFWQAFQLIPVSGSFEFAGSKFEVLPARHHGLNSAFSLHLPGKFYYTGDSRPIPEILEHIASDTPYIFHDCSVVGNPSHSGIDDLQQSYSPKVLERIFVYHYNKDEQKQAFEKAGLKCVTRAQEFEL